jgi:hypothetical protein
MTEKIIHTTHSIVDQVKNIWFILAAFVAVIFWVARHETALPDIQENKARIGHLERHIIILESNFSRLQMQIDGIRDDLGIIKQAVLK